MKKQRFTKKEAIKIAKQFKTQEELRSGNPDLYYWAHHKKVFHWFKPFMMGNFKHTKESAFKVAKRYTVFSEFRKNHKDVLSFLQRQNLHEEATKHMKRKYNRFYSKRFILSKLSSFKYWDEFVQNGCQKTYKYILSHKLKSLFCPKYIKDRGRVNSWSKSMIQYEMNKFKTNKEFLKKSPAAYRKALWFGLIDADFDPITGNRVWNKKNLLALCKKYQTFGDLVINEGNAPFNAAKRIGLKLPLIYTIYSGEVYLHKFLEKIIGIKFKKSRPSFLKNPMSGRNLELDGFNEKFKIAFEHCGAFHNKPDTKKRDLIKKKLCKKNNIKVIYINDIIYFYKMDENKIKKTIESQLKKLNIVYDNDKLSTVSVFNKKVKNYLIKNNSKVNKGWSKLKRTTSPKKLY